MRQPKVSVITSTWRPGGIDVLFRGIADQTYEDFEYILVDHRYEKRHEVVVSLAEEMGIRNFIHAPEHRRNGPWYVGASGWNTGFLLAEGEVIIMLMDYAYAPKGWIQAHLQHHIDGVNRLVLSPHQYYTSPGVVKERNGSFNEISIYRGGYFNPSWISSLTKYQYPHIDPKLNLPKGACAYYFCHAKNESFPLEKVLEIGGADETMDQGKGPWDMEFGARFQYSGCLVFNEPAAMIHSPDPRRIAGLETMPGVVDDQKRIGDMGLDWSKRWTYAQGEKYQFDRIDKYKRGAPPVAPNPFNFMEERKRIWEWRKANFIDVATLEISDEQYYGEEIHH